MLLVHHHVDEHVLVIDTARATELHKITAKQEAHLDLFVEQTVGPDLASAMLTAFQIGVEAGLPPEALVLELYMSGEMGRSIQAMADFGFFQQVKLHGFTAAYGGMIRFMELDRESRAINYRRVLDEISQHTFADGIEKDGSGQNGRLPCLW